jgi:RNase H-fold protein (predicted Holliday junction resolvase)
MQSIPLKNCPQFMNLKRSKKKKIKKKKIAQLQSKITNSIQFNKFAVANPMRFEKQMKNIMSYRDQKTKPIKIHKKLTQYDISMKKPIKRYTPVSNPIKNTIEVHHMNSLNMPNTARHL